MTDLAIKDGGLVMKSGGLGTSCSCCEEACPCGPFTIFGGAACDCCSISMDVTEYDGGYYKFSQLEKDHTGFSANRRGPTDIVWQTGYPAALNCYFWWFSFISCSSVTGSDEYAKFVRYQRLFQCENGTLVNRTYEAVVSGKFYGDTATINVANTAWGYAIKQVVIQGTPEDEYDDLNGQCLTEVEDIEPHLPELTC